VCEFEVPSAGAADERGGCLRQYRLLAFDRAMISETLAIVSSERVLRVELGAIAPGTAHRLHSRAL